MRACDQLTQLARAAIRQTPNDDARLAWPPSSLESESTITQSCDLRVRNATTIRPRQGLKCRARDIAQAHFRPTSRVPKLKLVPFRFADKSARFDRFCRRLNQLTGCSSATHRETSRVCQTSQLETQLSTAFHATAD